MNHLTVLTLRCCLFWNWLMSFVFFYVSGRRRALEKRLPVRRKKCSKSTFVEKQTRPKVIIVIPYITPRSKDKYRTFSLNRFHRFPPTTPVDRFHHFSLSSLFVPYSIPKSIDETNDMCMVVTILERKEREGMQRLNMEQID